MIAIIDVSLLASYSCLYPVLTTFNHPSINQFYQVMASLLIFTGWLLSVINGSQLYFYGQELVKRFY